MCSNHSYGRAFNNMNIFLAVIGASIWCSTVYLVLKLLGVDL